MTRTESEDQEEQQPRSWLSLALIIVLSGAAMVVGLIGRIIFGRWWVPYYMQVGMILSSTPQMTMRQRAGFVGLWCHQLRRDPVLLIALANEMDREVVAGTGSDVYDRAYLEASTMLRDEAERIEPRSERRVFLLLQGIDVFDAWIRAMNEGRIPDEKMLKYEREWGWLRKVDPGPVP